MNNPVWVIQKNLTNPATLSALKKAAEADGASVEEIVVVPFSEQIKYEPDGRPFVFYGSTTMMLAAIADDKLRPGIFYDKEAFAMSSYIRAWGEHVLNADGVLKTVGELISDSEMADRTYFVRPDGDDKLLAGGLMPLSELKETLAKSLGQNPRMDASTGIFLAEPKRVGKEWRNFIVEGKAVSSCRYAEDGHLSVDAADIPEDMIRFAEERASEWAPHGAFALDVAFFEGRYRIVECNCFNGTGFYGNSLDAVVKSVNAYLRKNSA